MCYLYVPLIEESLIDTEIKMVTRAGGGGSGFSASKTEFWFYKMKGSMGMDGGNGGTTTCKCT